MFRIIFDCNLSSYLRCSLIKDLGSSPFPLSLRCILLAPPANMPIISFHFFDTKYPLFCQLFFLWPCSHYGWTVLIEYQINKKISESSSLSVALSLCSPWRWHTTLLTSDDDAVVISITEISTFVQRQWLHFEKTEDFEQLWSVSDWTSVVSWEVEGKKIALRDLAVDMDLFLKYEMQLLAQCYI